MPFGRRHAEPRRRILVVEDDNEARSLLHLLLQLDGWLVDTAANGQEAIGRLERELPDVILLDLVMPGVNGWDVLARRAVEPTWIRIPVIVMSASPYSAETVLDLGATAFLAKPFSIDQLRTTLDRTVP